MSVWNFRNDFERLMEAYAKMCAREDGDYVGSNTTVDDYQEALEAFFDAWVKK